MARKLQYLLALLVGCSGSATGPTPSAPPAQTDSARPLERGPKTVRRRGDGDPRVVSIRPLRYRSNEQPGEVELVGHKGWTTRLYQRPRPSGGAALFESLEPVGGSLLVRRANVSAGSDRAPSNSWELLLPSGQLVPWGRDGISAELALQASNIDPFVFTTARESYSLFDGRTGAKIGSRPRDPVKDARAVSNALSVFNRGTRLIEEVHGLDEGVEVRVSRMPSLALGLTRRGRLTAVAGSFALISMPASADPDAEDTRVEILDLEAQTMVESVALPKLLRSGASFAVSPDGKKIAAARFGGIHLYERASKRWTIPKTEIHYREGAYIPPSAIGFTADGKEICLRHGTPSFLPALPAAAAGSAHRVVFTSVYDRTCHVVPVPITRGYSLVENRAFGHQLLHVGSTISNAGDLAAFLDEQNPSSKRGEEWGARDVRLTVVEIASGKVRYQVSVGARQWLYGDDHLTVELGPSGVWVYSSTEEEAFGGLFDPVTGKRLAPMFVGSRAERVPLADFPASDGSGSLGTLLPAGKGALALLDGGAFDLVGDADETTLGCLLAPDQLLPLSACKDRFYVPGAVEDARAGKRTWLTR